MVNAPTFSSTSLALTFGSQYGLVAGCFPANSVRPSRSALPSRVRRAVHVIGLPIGHARSRAKNLIGMKVRRRAAKCVAAPFALFCYSIAARRALSPSLELLSAFIGTQFLISPSSAVRRLSAHPAWRWLCNAPPAIRKIALSAAKQIIRATVLRMKQIAAVLAIQCNVWISHVVIIGDAITIAKRFIELEERYCEIAANARA